MRKKDISRVGILSSQSSNEAAVREPQLQPSALPPSLPSDPEASLQYAWHHTPSVPNLLCIMMHADAQGRKSSVN